MTEILALHAFDDNYIWLLRAAGHVAVVDPGDAAPVLDYLERSGDRLCAILVTHHHGDHVGGVEEILARSATPSVPVFGPALENIPGVTETLVGGERIGVPEIGLELHVIAVPGHTRGHIAYYGPSLGEGGALFCGDTLFGAGCGRLFEGSAAQAVKYFPQNINVAATLSLASCAKERVVVKIIASPTCQNNLHQIEIEAEAGKLTVRTENVPSPGNPKTSFLAALSAVTMLRDILDYVRIGT